jgi:hypothetical protein
MSEFKGQLNNILTELKNLSRSQKNGKKFNEEVLRSKEELRISSKLLELNPKIKVQINEYHRDELLSIWNRIKLKLLKKNSIRKASETIPKRNAKAIIFKRREQSCRKLNVM